MTVETPKQRRSRRRAEQRQAVQEERAQLHDDLAGLCDLILDDLQYAAGLGSRALVIDSLLTRAREIRGRL